MRLAAEFGALPGVIAGFFDVEIDVVDASAFGRDRARLRIHIALAADARHPEAVHHIRRMKLQIDVAADRQHQLVGRYHAELGIAELPPPLMSDDFDDERVLGRPGLRRENAAHRRHQDEQHDNRRDQRPRDLEAGVSVDVLWFRGAGPVAELHDQYDQQKLDDDHDAHRPPEGVREQMVEQAAELCDGLEGGLRILGAGTTP